ncbi:hypothetical protein KIN_07750 [Litoreibacter roseus]|uniref:Uncharacterized protein n=1 Tax=Litoreibacter roseus TaxID=2601869 RepID=A0A6N6JBP4_9RHOB|nr:hypothetical protein KIN_07750 [Litoreibacter roseus]
MVRFFKIMVFLLVTGFSAIVGYAYFGDLAPNQVEINQPVEFDVD